MATGSVGSLTVVLGLDAAQYVSGLTKAQYQARQFGENIGKSIKDGAALAVASLATISTGAIAAFATFDHLVKSAGDFQDLAEKTGASAEALASFGVAAGTAGTSVDAIAQASVRLTKNLTGVDDESKEAGAAIAALGLNLKDFKSLAPEDQITEISKALAGFQDGAQKTAVATALFGKAGADLLPFLKALEEQGGRQVILTAQQIAQADEYADKQAEATAKLQQYAQAAATQALPALTAFTGVVTDAIKKLSGLGNEAKLLGANDGVAKFAENAIDNLAFVVDAAQGVKVVFSRVGEFIGASVAAAQAKLTGDTEGLKAIRAAYDESLNTSQFKSVRDQYRKALADQKKFQADSAKYGFGNRPGTPNPELKFNGATKRTGGAGADATKNILDNQLKAYENAAKEEQDILQSRNKMLDLYNSANLISTKDYYNGKRVAQEQAVADQAALYDKEIAALQDYQAKAGKATERESAQGKINDLVAKKAKLYRDAGEAAIEMGFKEQQANDALLKQLNSVNAEVLELTGNLGAAARLRVGDQFSDITKRLQANGDTAGLAQVDRLKQLKIAQADYGQQTEEVARITQSLQLQEERIQISRQLGADSELSSLIKLRDARQATVAQMQSIVEAQEAIARASGNPALIQNAEQARVALEKLAAEADPLADKFNTIFTDSFGDAFADFITGTKSAKEAFASFTSSVVSQLAKIIAQDAAKSLFSSFLGSSSSGTAGGIGALLSSFFGHAGGGLMSPNSMARVNENGPELLDVNGKQYLMNGGRNAKITSNSRLGGGMVYSPTFVLNEPASRKTQEQLSRTAFLGAQRATARSS